MKHSNVQSSSINKYTYNIDRYKHLYCNDQVVLTIKTASGLRPQQKAMKLLSASVALPSLPLLLLLIIQLFQTPVTILAQNTSFVTLYDCPATTTANYTSGSQFESNLKNLLFPTLISNGSLDGFFNTSSGTDSDTIYGLVQCRFDVSAADCKICLTAASGSILEVCPNKMDASIRFENCLLRYSKTRFFSQMILSEIRYTYWYWNNDYNITDLPVFNKQLGVLFTNLTSLASLKPLKYATGKISYSDLFSNIYGLADCTQDLSSTDCYSCLQIMLSKIPGCCSGKKNAWVLSPSCRIWYRDVEFLGPPPALPPPPPSTKPSPVSPSPANVTKGDTNGNSNQPSPSPNIAVIVGPALVGAAVLLLLVLCVWYMRRKKGTKKPNYSEIMDGDIRSAESLQFEFAKIRTATKNFSESHKLGEGGFGEVYKGELPDGQEIAVKRLSKNSGQGLEEFKNEVVLLHKLQHRNLVRLLGFCLEGKETLLIYEYVPNRSLDKHLFAPTKRAYLDWGKRYKIIGGISRGLLYLHEDSRLRIIHRDLKAANILLDGEMDAKIADFGMAKLFGSNQTQGNTSRIGGTFGYIAPEYALHGLFSVKSDVFSFGVLVLEIVSGQRITSFHQSNTQQNLLSYAWKQWREGTALVLMDPTLSDSFLEYEVMKSIHIGLLCVQENVENRPTMSTVVSLLNSNSVTMAAPSQPAFFADSGTNSYMVTREQESDLYKRYEPESNQSTAITLKSDYASKVGFHKTQPR